MPTENDKRACELEAQATEYRKQHNIPKAAELQRQAVEVADTKEAFIGRLNHDKELLRRYAERRRKGIPGY